MNYRHAFHAGNFADVVKHAVLARVLVHLCRKPAAFRVIDTHAGAGRYELAGPEASRTGEWRDGIGRLAAATLAPAFAALLAPYLDAVAGCNAREALTVYPGSPLIARAFLRPQDRLIACELEPHAAAALARNLAGDARCKAIAIDGFTAFNAYIPPKERRGLVLIDPSFEDADDFTRLAQALVSSQRKWASGIYLTWYPIKDRAAPQALAKRLKAAGLAKLLRIEIEIVAGRDPARLGACGLIILNPPWMLADELQILLAGLADILSPAGPGRFHLDWLAGEK
jgi:23S rRNA (adenine2030-N6)-methyltransferase